MAMTHLDGADYSTYSTLGTILCMQFGSHGCETKSTVTLSMSSMLLSLIKVLLPLHMPRESVPKERKVLDQSRGDTYVRAKRKRKKYGVEEKLEKEDR
jgi:hypothetical protein